MALTTLEASERWRVLFIGVRSGALSGGIQKIMLKTKIRQLFIRMRLYTPHFSTANQGAAGLRRHWVVA
jgi:hypothetical protein